MVLVVDKEHFDGAQVIQLFLKIQKAVHEIEKMLLYSYVYTFNSLN